MFSTHYIAYSSKFLLVLLPLLFAGKSKLACAQPAELHFKNYTSHDGLSQNSVYDITQDAEGFMWFATQDGLNRFDGLEFKIYSPQHGSGEKLPSNHITSLYYDHHEKLLWVGTVRGIAFFSTEKDSLQLVTDVFEFADILENLPVKKIMSFKKGEYWIISQNQGLFQMNSAAKTVQSYFFDPVNSPKVNSIVNHGNKLITAVGQQLFALSPVPGETYKIETLNLPAFSSDIRVLYSQNNMLWVGSTTEGCFYIDDIEMEEPLPQPCIGLTSGGIGSFITDASGHIWAGTRGNGVFRYASTSTDPQTARNNPFNPNSLGKDFVLSMFKDRQHIIWIGLSGGGVAKYNPLRYNFTTWNNNPYNTLSLPDNMVFDIFKSEQGQLYAGTQNRGFIKADLDSGQFYTYPYFSTPGVPENTVYNITEYPGGVLWLATWGGLIRFDESDESFRLYENPDLITSEKLYAVHKLHQADSLYITGENGPAFFSLSDEQWKPASDTNPLQANAYIGRYIYEDDTNQLWLSSEGGGLITYDYVNDTYEIIEEVRNISPYSRHVFHDQNILWVATDNGIVLYNMIEKRVERHIELKDEHLSNVMYAIEKDTEKNMWASTNIGFYKIDSQTYHYTRHDLDSGLFFLEYNTACSFRENNGTIIFCGTGGITAFNPAGMQENDFSPDPIITAFEVNGRLFPVNSHHPLIFNHDQNFITIRYAVNNFSNQEKNQFEYRLSGLSEQWTNNRNNNRTTYNGLSPGRYNFQLKSSNSDGKWSDNITSLSFIISPPWWQQAWFRLPFFLIMILFGVILVKRKIRHIQQEADLKSKIAETEMMALRAQMNPHFIFNCMNTIDAFIQENDKYKATIYLNKFARLLRNVLDSSKNKTIRLSKDLETLQLYLELEQLRNEYKFTYKIAADEHLLQDDFKIPPLIVQPYVENAIQHGIKPQKGNSGKIDIVVSMQNGHIKYVIEDNGVGRKTVNNNQPKGHRSYGMQMSKDRVKFFNNEKDASVLVTDLIKNGKPAGTRVEVLLKLK